MPEFTHAIETITVTQAKNLLAKNDSNRSLSVTTVNKYARDMENGDWNQPSSAAIVIDTDGNIIDGQHRLSAQVKVNKSMKWLVIRNMPKEAQKTMDTGKARSVSDVLHFEGEQRAQMLAAVSRNVYRINHNLMAGGATVTVSEIMKTIEDHPDVRRSAEMAEQGKKSFTPIAPSVFGAAHWMITQVNGSADADIFLWRMYNLTHEGDGSPVLALARRCNEIRRQQQRVHHRDFLAMIIKAWNLDAAGKTANKIATYSKTGTYVLPEVVKRKVSLVEVWDAKTEALAEGTTGDDETDDEDGMS